jgi:ABC-type bacteriocin/lantibiotic exporter with double-glycine peptidase domain
LISNVKLLFEDVNLKDGIRVFLLVIFMALFEVAGIASIMPFLAFLANPSGFLENTYALKILSFLPINMKQNHLNIAFVFGIFSLLMLTSTVMVRAYTTFRLNTFIELSRHKLATSYMQDYLGVSYRYMIENNSSSFTKALLSEVDQYIGMVFRPLIIMLAYAVVAVAVLSFLLVYNWQMTFAVIVFFSIAYAVMYKLVRQKLHELGEVNVKSNEARFKSAYEVAGGIKAIKILRTERYFMERYYSASLDFSKAQATKQTATLIPNDFTELLVFGGAISSVLGYIVFINPSVESTIDNLFAPLSVFAFSAYRLKPAAFNIFIGLSSLRFGDAILTNLIHLKKALKSDKKKQSYRGDPLPFNRVSYENLTFSYNSDSRPILSDQTIELSKGDVLGIIGASGSGKSTLIDILMGLLEPSSGVKLIDGQVLKAAELSRWDDLFGYVPQDLFVLDENYYANIAFGESSAEIDKSKVMEACQKARLHDFIVSNDPSGYEAVLGEGGIKLSGGQKQRLGIARALYFDPQILILDEGTSALDEKVEDEILNNLDILSDTLTIVMVTHRLNTLRICNRVIELGEGVLCAK